MQRFALLAFLLPFGGLAMGQPAGNPAHVTTIPYARDGTPVDADFPAPLHLKNTGGSDGPRGPGSGSGLCVFTSIENNARYSNCRILQGFQHWMTRKPGGGWPEKVDAMIALYSKEQNASKPAYVQVEGNDLAIVKAAVRTGRMVGVTYAVSPTGRYGGKRIAHMLNLVAAGAGEGPDGKGWWAIVDNNFPRSWEWMSEAQFLRAYAGGSQGWMFCLLNPPPPPAPLH